MDKSTFHRAVESVTGMNYLRDTDERNLTDPTAEAVSVFASYGEPHDSSAVVPVGFVFIGTIDLVNQIPSIVKGHCLTNQQSNSAMIGSIVVVATIAEWWAAINRSKGNQHLERCFVSVRSQIEPLNPRTNLKRLT